MKKLIRLLNNRLVLAGLLVSALTVDLVLMGRAAGLQKADWAAWVQAVGSILAIVGAFAVSAFQSKNEMAKDRALARADVQRKLRGIAGITRAAEFCCDTVCEVFEKEGRYDRVLLEMLYAKNNFDDTLTALKAIPMHELGTQDAVIHIFYIKDNLVRLQQTVEAALRIPYELPGPPGGSSSQAVLDKEKELSQWVGAYSRGVKMSVTLFHEHPDL